MSTPYLQANEGMIENVAARRGPEDQVVTYHKEALASTRAEALTSLEEFLKLCEALTPQFDKAWELVLQANSKGVPAHDVHNCVVRYRELASNGPNSFKGVVWSIDNLDVRGINNSWHLAYPGNLRMAQGLSPAVQALARDLAAHISELEKRIKNTPVVTRPPVMGVVNDPPRGVIDVETGIGRDPRER